MIIPVLHVLLGIHLRNHLNNVLFDMEYSDFIM